MNKNIEKRIKDVRKYVDRSASTTEAVRYLAKKLYLSEATIWRDLKRSDSKQ